MPSVYDFKPRFQAILRPLVGACVSHGVTPNHLTLAALAGSVAVGGALAFARERPLLLLVLPAWLLARMALNAMDGMAAREHGMKTALGAVLNELGDVLSDLALYLPLALLSARLRWPVTGFCLGAIVTEFAGVLGQALGAHRRYDGPMGKSDRALLLGAMGLVTALWPRLLEWWPIVMLVAALLTVVTSANRLRGALRELREAGRR
ncbi:MAG TPA: CDP-alcohol phosphatidyltransferase family protein [Candidatus Eisenbacteria bacterium]